MPVRGDPDMVMNFSGVRDLEQANLWLDAASTLVDARLATSGLTDATLARMEEHLAAHFIELGGGRFKSSERLPDWSATYAAASGMLGLLNSTRNGVIVLNMDSTGTLLSMNLPRPTFQVLDP